MTAVFPKWSNVSLADVDDSLPPALFIPSAQFVFPSEKSCRALLENQEQSERSACDAQHLLSWLRVASTASIEESNTFPIMSHRTLVEQSMKNSLRVNNEEASSMTLTATPNNHGTSQASICRNREVLSPFECLPGVQLFYGSEDRLRHGVRLLGVDEWQSVVATPAGPPADLTSQQRWLFVAEWGNRCQKKVKEELVLTTAKILEQEQRQRLELHEKMLDAEVKVIVRLLCLSLVDEALDDFQNLILLQFNELQLLVLERDMVVLASLHGEKALQDWTGQLDCFKQQLILCHSQHFSRSFICRVEEIESERIEFEHFARIVMVAALDEAGHSTHHLAAVGRELVRWHMIEQLELHHRQCREQLHNDEDGSWKHMVDKVAAAWIHEHAKSIFLAEAEESVARLEQVEAQWHLWKAQTEVLVCSLHCSAIIAMEEGNSRRSASCARASASEGHDREVLSVSEHEQHIILKVQDFAFAKAIAQGTDAVRFWTYQLDKYRQYLKLCAEERHVRYGETMGELFARERIEFHRSADFAKSTVIFQEVGPRLAIDFQWRMIQSLEEDARKSIAEEHNQLVFHGPEIGRLNFITRQSHQVNTINLVQRALRYAGYLSALERMNHDEFVHRSRHSILYFTLHAQLQRWVQSSAAVASQHSARQYELLSSVVKIDSSLWGDEVVCGHLTPDRTVDAATKIAATYKMFRIVNKYHALRLESYSNDVSKLRSRLFSAKIASEKRRDCILNYRAIDFRGRLANRSVGSQWMDPYDLEHSNILVPHAAEIDVKRLVNFSPSSNEVKNVKQMATSYSDPFEPDEYNLWNSGTPIALKNIVHNTVGESSLQFSNHTRAHGLRSESSCTFKKRMEMQREQAAALALLQHMSSVRSSSTTPPPRQQRTPTTFRPTVASCMKINCIHSIHDLQHAFHTRNIRSITTSTPEAGRREKLQRCAKCSSPDTNQVASGLVERTPNAFDEQVEQILSAAVELEWRRQKGA